MKAIPTKHLAKALRHLGFQPVGGGHRGGHDTWQDLNGKTCHPVSFSRQHDVPLAHLFSLGLELENKGVCGRAEFMGMVKNPAPASRWTAA